MTIYKWCNSELYELADQLLHSNWTVDIRINVPGILTISNWGVFELPEVTNCHCCGLVLVYFPNSQLKFAGVYISLTVT